ncbi:hypothetical protein BDV26DRAFT_273020 [Aspergillus bertholletiae]|uniref:Uncharacterized protein n=1 Tax=Aspergillus bertholletiae TaxID=1226010 RepID=A0A5N7AVZ0_9EURO|nr:hypothetical protein BDV26DRAFT_273020 [Aspergillus bertholletiae]
MKVATLISLLSATGLVIAAPTRNDPAGALIARDPPVSTSGGAPTDKSAGGEQVGGEQAGGKQAGGKQAGGEHASGGQDSDLLSSLSGIIPGLSRRENPSGNGDGGGKASGGPLDGILSGKGSELGGVGPEAVKKLPTGGLNGGNISPGLGRRDPADLPGLGDLGSTAGKLGGLNGLVGGAGGARGGH